MAMNTRAVRRSNLELFEWLRPRFQEFNVQFFDGKLPEYEIRILTLIPGTLVPLPNAKPRQLPRIGNRPFLGLCVAAHQLIFMGSQCAALKDECVRAVLLHEMCHAEVCRKALLPPIGDPHGAEFLGELDRLANLGEAWAHEQARYYRTLPPNQQARCSLEDWCAARRRSNA